MDTMIYRSGSRAESMPTGLAAVSSSFAAFQMEKAVSDDIAFS
jgi:hypothetical protein